MLKKNFDTEMKLLRLETSIISEDCNKAEKMSDLAMNTINLIEEMDAHLNEKEDMSYDSDTSSRAKKRWIGAIKRVLCKNKQSKSTENIDENDDKSNAKNFPFKIPAQNRKKSFGVKKDVPSDIQNKIPLKCEGVVRRNSKEFNDEKEMDSNEARRERMENFYFAPKSPPKKRNSLNPADDVIVRAHVKDSMFSNLSRVRRVTAGDVSSHIIAAVGVREMKEVKEKICIPRHSIAAPQTPVRNRVDGAVSVAGAGDIPQIGGRGKVRRTPATPEIEHINRVRKAAGVLPRLSLNPADKLIVNPYGGMPVPTLPSISFSNMRSAS